MVTSIISHYHITVNNSPLVWDVTVITAYFVLTATYLMLTLRYDLTRLRDELPDHFEPIYKALTIGYTEREDPVVERMVWWLALAIIIMAPLLLHGGVIPWLFALLPSMPGWFGAIQGPQFLTIALTSAISGVIILSFAFRWAYDWEHIFTDDIFRGLTLWLGFFSLLFLWLQLQQIIGGTFNPTVSSGTATDARLHHPVYLAALSVVAGALGYIFAQAVKPALFSKRKSVVASFGVLLATLSEKVLFVIEGLLYPNFSIYGSVPGSYTPSIIELWSVVGTVGMVATFFLILAKIVPVVELHAIEHLQETGGHTSAHEQATSTEGDT
jgi:molybdopterin-containing oxidoreductase family membrane subunit